MGRARVFVFHTMRKVWIIEVKFSPTYLYAGSRDWEPTVGTALSLPEAETALRDFKRNCPDEMFRITPYMPTSLCP